MDAGELAAIILDAIRSGRDLYLYDRYIIGPDGTQRAREVLIEKRDADQTTELGGGFKYNSTISSVFSANSRSLLSLNVRTRCGFNFFDRQIRPTEEGLTFTTWAKLRVLQWVESAGGSWVVFWKICAICSGWIRRCRPDRGESSNPSVPCCRNRFSQRRTVCRAIPNCSAISRLALPAADCRMILARSTARAATVRPFAQRSSSSCCG